MKPARLLACCAILVGVAAIMTFFVSDERLTRSLSAAVAVSTILFTGVVAASTVKYARLTEALVGETRRLREVETEPVLSVYIESSENCISFIRLIIENIGRGAASDISFASLPDFQGSQNGRPLSEFGPFKNGIPYLSAGQRIATFLTSLFEDHDRKMKTTFTIRARYKGPTGVSYEMAFPIEFSMFESLSRVGNPPMETIAKSIEKMSQTMDHVATGFNKPTVIVTTQEKLNRADLEYIEHQRRGATPANDGDEKLKADGETSPEGQASTAS